MATVQGHSPEGVVKRRRRMIDLRFFKRDQKSEPGKIHRDALENMPNFIRVRLVSSVLTTSDKQVAVAVIKYVTCCHPHLLQSFILPSNPLSPLHFAISSCQQAKKYP